jgi:hypothetical protein
MSATASLGLVTLWDVEGGLPQVRRAKRAKHTRAYACHAHARPPCVVHWGCLPVQLGCGGARDPEGRGCAQVAQARSRGGKPIKVPKHARSRHTYGASTPRQPHTCAARPPASSLQIDKYLYATDQYIVVRGGRGKRCAVTSHTRPG